MRVWLVLILCLAPMVAAAEPQPVHPGAGRRIERAQRLYLAGRYADAAAELSAAYAIDPRREILYPWAQATRLAGDCPRAIELYDRFLAEDPPPDERALATENRALCEVVAAAAPPPPDAGPPARADALSPRTEPVGTTPSSHDRAASGRVSSDAQLEASSAGSLAWYRDGIGAVMLGVGTVALGAGGGMLVISRGQADEAAAAASYDESAARWDESRTSRNVGLASIGLGAALVAVGAFRVVTAEAPRATLTAWTHDGSGGGLSVAGAF